MTFGNTAAARGWLEESTRLVADHGLSRLVGWIQLCRAVTEHDDGDPIAAEKWAREAAEGGRRGGRARDLDVCARSELGAALVDQGRVAEGLPLLDGSMSGALSGDLDRSCSPCG
ncbi:hypothetical protein ISU10_04990 [Nocardioides agariphilus]|uniref:Uncharacterized protein n=1 Tax=Nocardioides agariphilus TaxID=433664 RepID=A0A930VI81_9ACTN|nr:hypothetical protein [Nocardioides agariphilus]MBF4767117.1 hypothetical protein [Nocardioides agariphilus]